MLAFTQTIESSFSSSGHVNYLEEVVRRLKKREGVIFLKRLTILLDDASEKGTGLVSCFTFIGTQSHVTHSGLCFYRLSKTRMP